MILGIEIYCTSKDNIAFNAIIDNAIWLSCSIFCYYHCNLELTLV